MTAAAPAAPAKKRPKPHAAAGSPPGRRTGLHFALGLGLSSLLALAACGGAAATPTTGPATGSEGETAETPMATEGTAEESPEATEGSAGSETEIGDALDRLAQWLD